MRKLLYATAIALLATSPALAVDINSPKANANSNSNANANSASFSNSKSNAKSFSASGAVAKTGDSGASSSATINEKRNAPGFALGGLGDGPCTGKSGQLALSFGLGGGGFGFADEDVECTKRQTVRVIMQNFGDDPVMVDYAKRIVFSMEPVKNVAEKSMASVETKPTELTASATAPNKEKLGKCDERNKTIPLECTLGLVR